MKFFMMALTVRIYEIYSEMAYRSHSRDIRLLGKVNRGGATYLRPRLFVANVLNIATAERDLTLFESEV